MTVLAQVNERNFPAQDNTFAFSVDAALTTVTITLTHPDWPEGECIRLEVWWDGVPGGVMSSSGGVIRDKAGNPTGGTSSLTWTTNKPGNVSNGVAHVQVMQGLRTAVLVEGF